MSQPIKILVRFHRIHDCRDAVLLVILEIKTFCKRDFLLNEIPTPDSRYFDEPDEFKSVKDVPAIFTINKLNFTQRTIEECDCAQPIIEGQEKFKNQTSQFIKYKFYACT